MIRLIIVLAVLGMIAVVAIRASWRIERSDDELRDEQRRNESRERELRPRPPIQ